jgi:hypothetical protein
MTKEERARYLALIRRQLQGYKPPRRIAIARLAHAGAEGVGHEVTLQGPKQITAAALRGVVDCSLAVWHLGPADHPLAYRVVINDLGRDFAGVLLKMAQAGEVSDEEIAALRAAGILAKPVETTVAPPPSGVVAKAVAPAPRASGVRAR